MILAAPDAEPVIQVIRRWVDRVVIGLNLCPFAKGVQVKGQVRYAVSDASDTEGVLQDLGDELARLIRADTQEIDTTLLILPRACPDFYDFNALTAWSERLLKRMQLVGQIQIATFHPAFRFAGSEANAVEHCTNRSPYPILHLLREASIDRAVQAFPEAGDIYEKNIATMRRLGHTGWRKLLES